MISFKEILNYMQAGAVFTLQIISYDKKRKQGGKIKTYRAKLMKEEKSGRKLTSSEQNRTRSTHKHSQYFTRNIVLITEDGFETTIKRKIHIPLIIQFNGKTVTP